MAKKVTSKKAVSKKPTSKKPASKKPSSKKTAAKKTTVKKTATIIKRNPIVRITLTPKELKNLQAMLKSLDVTNLKTYLMEKVNLHIAAKKNDAKVANKSSKTEEANDNQQ